jgi:dihydroflavonol-4-reductase
LEGRIPFKPAGGLSFVDVRDVACAMRSAMEKGQAGRRYLLGTSNLTLGAFFEKLSDISGTRAPRFRMPRNPVAIAGAFGAFMHSLGLPLDRGSAEIAQFYWYLDSSRAKMELDWVPRDPDETLRDTVADLNARGVVKCRVSKVRRGLRCCLSSSAASDDLLLNR